MLAVIHHPVLYLLELYQSPCSVNKKMIAIKVYGKLSLEQDTTSMCC